MKKYLVTLSVTAVLSLMMIVAVSARQVIAGGATQQIDTLYQATMTKDSVPITKVVPVQSEVVVNDSISVDSLKRHLTHSDRRALRREEFSQRVDSLVQSLTFAFRPTAMQAMPEGEEHLIYADDFGVLVSPMAIEVHLPVERRLSQNVSVLNFDNDGIRDLRPEMSGNVWHIAFATEYYDEEYYFDFLISSLTGEVVLTLQSPKYAMKYLGQIATQ